MAGQSGGQVGVCAALAACVPEWRRLHIHHLIERLVRQQVFQMACGYEYQNDADTLRGDPFITALLLPGNAHANRGVLSVLCVLVPLLRARWPGVAITLRADSGCAVPAL